MIKNYFNIAWRNLLKNKQYTAINIGGLALGMTFAMIIGQRSRYPQGIGITAMTNIEIS